jgi:hypothetical protein
MSNRVWNFQRENKYLYREFVSGTPKSNQIEVPVNKQNLYLQLSEDYIKFP